jgi:DNA-binding MarR family transcriptional regulator
VDGKKPSDPWTAFALAVFEVNGLIIGAGEGISRPLGQSSARWQVLGRVHSPKTVSDVARDIGLARQSVQRTTDVLASEGLVRFRPHPTDRRTQLVELTGKGSKVLSEIYRRQLAWSDELLERLDPATLKRATSSLSRVAAALREGVEGKEAEQPEEVERSR